MILLSSLEGASAARSVNASSAYDQAQVTDDLLGFLLPDVRRARIFSPEDNKDNGDGLSGAGGGAGGGGTVAGTSATISSGHLFAQGRDTQLIKFGLRKTKYEASRKGGNIAPGDKASVIAGPTAPTPLMTGGLFGDADDIGVGDLFGWLKQRVTPPGGKISRIQPLQPIAKILPAPIRTAFRLGGAAVQSVFAPALTGNMQRQIFGLSPKESSTFMQTQHVSRIVMGVIATYGAGVYIAGLAHPAAVAAGTTLGSGTAAGSTTVAAGGLTSIPIGITPFAGAPALEPLATAGLAVGAPLQPVIGLVNAATTTPGLVSAASVVKPAPGLLATTSAKVGETAALGLVSRLLNPGEKPTPETAPYQNPLNLPYNSPSNGPTGGGSVGGSENPEDTKAILAGADLPVKIILGGLAVTMAVKMFKARKARKGKA